MGDGLPPPREAARPRRKSATAALFSSGQTPQQQQQHHGQEVMWAQTGQEDHHGGPDRLTGESGRIMDRRHSSPRVVHQRHMPVAPQKFHIPRKTKEKLALFQPLSCESREYEEVLNVLTSGYLDPASSGCFTYSSPRLVHSEQLEKEFVEKRKEMKADGRTDKELEETYCFLLSDSSKLQTLCETGLFVAQSWVTVLGNPSKGVYVSRCSDLLQMNPFTPGATGEIIIFKVMKGKVKSIYENMKNLLDPTPRFDSHLSKNVSKVTSLMSYRAFELTQHYFYEYSFDELRQRPRQVCPHAVVSFQFKGKDAPLPNKPLAPVRLNSQSAERSQERAQYTVWSGDLVKDYKVLFQISLRSSSPPFLPHKLPEKLEMKWLMRLEQVTRRLPSSLFSYSLYNNRSTEVVKDGHCCSFLEVVDRNRSTTSVTKLLQELETEQVVLVTPLTERGFLFLLSSVQMALPHKRGETWRRSLQALFVFPESRETKSSPQGVCPEAGSDSVSAESLMVGLDRFVPALHFALVKARANPPPELSAGVEQQARDYFTGLRDGTMRPYPMGQYDGELEQGVKSFPVPKHHRVNVDSYLRSYLYGPALYMLLLSRVRLMMQTLCPKDEKEEQDERTTREAEAQQSKMKQLIDLVLACKRSAENELQSERAATGTKTSARKRRLEQETAERTLKHLKASQELKRLKASPQQDALNQAQDEVPASPSSLTSLIGSVGLKDTDLREEGSELASKLLALLTSLNQKATCRSLSEPQEEGRREASPFDGLALKLGLPPNCDIDLRRQDELEEQTAGSVSSSEGFSPSSHSGDLNQHRSSLRDRDRNQRRTAAVCEEQQQQQQQQHIPWVLIPITGLCSERYTCSDTDAPQDPRFQHLVSTPTPQTTTSCSMTTVSVAPVPSSSPVPGPLSPDPSPPGSPSQCPSPEPSPPGSPSHCPSPELEQEPELSLEDILGFDEDQELNEPITDEELQTLAVFRDRTDPSPTPDPCFSSARLSPVPQAPSPPDSPLSDSHLPGVLTLEPTSPPLLLQNIDAIVDQHLGTFSSDVQLILQNQHVSYSFPQSPHSTSHPERPVSSSPHAPISTFSQYVSFYEHSPPVHHYVSSLHKEIGVVLRKFENNVTPNRPDTTTTDLASRVSEFVASIRAANVDKDDPNEAWQTETQRDISCVTTSSMDCDERGEFMEETIQIQSEAVENEVSFGDEQDLSNCRRQVQFSSNHIEVSFRNEPERDVEEALGAESPQPEVNTAAPPFKSETSALSTLIDQLQPEVFTNLVEIIKDIKRNSQHFYVHSSETDDYTTADIRDQLLNQNYIEQSPVTFLNRESSSSRLLVVMKNQDIAAHVHQIPELVSLKRCRSVTFVGVDKSDDIRNHSYNELFVSGGQLISDGMILNPDYVSHERLTALLSVLELHTSPENVWKWKVHCRTHKKLKEQARFRRDAASLLDVLLSFQKRQLVEFLPYHKCDMSNQSCELLDCVLELQGRYSSYRHTLLLTENRLNSSSGGVIVCGVEEFLRDFDRLIGFSDDNKKQKPIRDELQSPEDLMQFNNIPSAPDQLVPELALTSSKDSIHLHSEQDFEVLRRAISQLRAERQKQLQESQTQETSGRTETMTLNPTEQRSFAPPSGQSVNSESVQLTPGRKAVSATLELIHSSLQPTDDDRANVQTGAGLSRSETGPRRSETGPSKSETGPSKSETGPRRSETGTTVCTTAASMSLNQSNVKPENNTTRSGSTEDNRTKTNGKRKKNMDEDGTDVKPAKKNRLENVRSSRGMKFLLVANALTQTINPKILANPNLWTTVALIREGFLPAGTAITPINETKLEEKTAQSHVRRVVHGQPKRCPKGWWPTRITIYDSREGPWALVEKVDRERKETKPVCLLTGRYSHAFTQRRPPPNEQFQEDGCDLVMYF